MLTKTNLKAIRIADQFVFKNDNGQGTIRCIKKGFASEEEPFAQPDVHHDISCDSEFTAGASTVDVTIETGNDSVIATVLNSLKEADEISLNWSPLDSEGERHMLSMQIERKGKQLSYILAVQDQAESLRAVA